MRVVGQAHGSSLYAMARADDDRPVVAERETKSVSSRTRSRSTSSTRVLLAAISTGTPATCANGCEGAAVGSHGHRQGAAARLHDLTRSATIAGPTDRPAVVSRLARGLLGDLDTSGGVRLLGVGVSGLADWIQDDLFAEAEDAVDEPLVVPTPTPRPHATGRATARAGCPGVDVEHPESGPGWVWGSGLGRVTVRFETAETGPGPVRTLAADDPDLVRRVITTDDEEDEIGGTEPDRPDVPARTTPATPD